MTWAAVTITILAALAVAIGCYAFLLHEEVQVLRSRLLTARETANIERQKFENADRLAARLASDLDAERAYTASLEARLGDVPTRDRPPLPHRYHPQPDPELVAELESWLCAPAWLPPHERRIRPATPPEDGGQP